MDSEKIPSAVERYMGEANRVTAVLEGRLARQKKEYGDSGEDPWFAGNKLTKRMLRCSVVSWFWYSEWEGGWV